MEALFINLSFDLRGHSLQVNVELTIQGNAVIQTLTFKDEDLYAHMKELGQDDWDFGAVCSLASKALGGIKVLPPPEYLGKIEPVPEEGSPA